MILLQSLQQLWNGCNMHQQTSLKAISNLEEYLTYDDVLLLPNYSEVVPAQTDTSVKLANGIRLNNPIIASPMDTVCEKEMALKMSQLGALGIIHRNMKIEQQVAQVKYVLDQNEKCGAAVGVGDDFKQRVNQLVATGLKIICIDSAHGHSKNVIQAIKYIKKHFNNMIIIAGNIATGEAALDLINAGTDVLKVGMGPGSICTTRVVSGMGVPQLTAVANCVDVARKHEVTVIADGGIRSSGDIMKALAIGANTVILGNLLAGTDASPGEVVEHKGQKYKAYRGMGSLSAMKEGSAARYGQKYHKGKADKLVAEGIEGLVKYKGSVENIIYKLVGGIKSGLGYLGAKNITQLREKARFIKVSQSGLVESKPHSIIEVSYKGS